MGPLVWGIGATLVLTAVSLAGLGFTTLGERRLRALLFALVAFAAGALLSAAIFHLLPESFEELGSTKAGLTVVGGFSAFFFLERVLQWRHCHDGHCDVHPYTTLSLLGGAIHNLVDGVIIGGAFLVNPGLGIATTVVILAHAIPQEMGDFAILVHGGYPVRKALLSNLVSSLPSVLGAMVAFFGLVRNPDLVPFLMAFAAGNFIYVGSSDLVPELHKQPGLKKALVAMALFLLAVGIVATIGAFGAHGH